MSVGAAGSPRG